MAIIKKAKETMTAKERVIRTFNKEKTDRITIGYETNPVARTNLCNALGISTNDDIGLKKNLGVDYAGVGAPYTGPALYAEIPDRYRDPQLGAVMRYVENAFGSYWDFCDFPLKDANDEEIYSHPFPNPDHYDYDEAGRHIDRLIDQGFAIHVGGAGLGDVLNTTGMLMGVEDALVQISTGNEATLDLIDRRINSNLAVVERILEKNKGKIDFMWMGEDLGTQHTPLISLDMYNEYIRPRHQRVIDMAKHYGLPIQIHTCGSSSWVYEELIKMGMTGVDTLQPEATNMSPEYLSKTFGGRLCFRGCISTAGPLAYGTAEETEAICKQTLEIMMQHKGYHFAPTHSIQDNTPAENLLAMYNAAHKYGVYA